MSVVWAQYMFVMRSKLNKLPYCAFGFLNSKSVYLYKKKLVWQYYNV